MFPTEQPRRAPEQTTAKTRFAPENMVGFSDEAVPSAATLGCQDATILKRGLNTSGELLLVDAGEEEEGERSQAGADVVQRALEGEAFAAAFL